MNSNARQARNGHQVLLRNFGVDEESKMVSRAALKSEEIDGADT